MPRGQNPGTSSAMIVILAVAIAMFLHFNSRNRQDSLAYEQVLQKQEYNLRINELNSVIDAQRGEIAHLRAELTSFRKSVENARKYVRQELSKARHIFDKQFMGHINNSDLHTKRLKIDDG